MKMNQITQIIRNICQSRKTKYIVCYVILSFTNVEHMRVIFTSHMTHRYET